jgi:hypothetical protein
MQAVKSYGQELTRDEWQEVRAALDRHHGASQIVENASLSKAVYEAVQLRPSVFGVGVDVKKLIDFVADRVRRVRIRK